MTSRPINVCRDMERGFAKRLDIYAEWKRFRTSGTCDKCDCESGRQVAKKNYTPPKLFSHRSRDSEHFLLWAMFYIFSSGTSFFHEKSGQNRAGGTICEPVSP